MLSNGRLLPAFGVGSARSRDYSATGIPTKGRGQRSAEGLEILTRLWTEDEVTFEGRHFQLDRASINPKPLQNPMPLWVGGSAAQAIERTARWGTGWQAGIESPDDVSPVIDAIKRRADELVRYIDPDHFGAGFSFRFGAPDDPQVARYQAFLSKRLGREAKGFTAAGGVDEMMALAHEFAAAGVRKFILRPIAEGTSEMLAQTQKLAEQLLPEINKMQPSASSPA